MIAKKKSGNCSPAPFCFIVRGGIFARRKDIKLTDYGISKYLYEELHSFCEQYGEKKDKINSKELAETILKKYKEDIELIEKTAKEVDKEFAPYLIKNVTTGMSLQAMETNYGIQMRTSEFNKKRRLFYYLLAYYKNCV